MLLYNITRYSYIDKMTHLLMLIQDNNIRPSVFYNMICLDVEVPENLDMVRFFYLFRHMVVPLRLHLDTVLLTQIPMDHLGSICLCTPSEHALCTRWQCEIVSSAALHRLHIIGETSDFSILAFSELFYFKYRACNCLALTRFGAHCRPNTLKLYD